MHLVQIGGGDISRRGARIEVGDLLGINEATRRNWIRAELGEGATPPASSVGAGDEAIELRREVAQLRQANEIPRVVSAFPGSGT